MWFYHGASSVAGAAERMNAHYTRVVQRKQINIYRQKKRLNAQKVFCRWRGTADGAANALIKNCARLHKAALFDVRGRRAARFYRSEGRVRVP